MIRSLWTLVKISIVVGIVIWLAERPGTITIDWMPYKFTVQVGFALLVMLGIVVLGIIIFSVIKTFADLPKTMARYRDITHKEKGLKALTIGLSAVAAGDAKAAAYQAHRAQNFLKSSDSALPKLLEAQAARLDGREVDAARNFIELMEDKDASFLGVRGLLQSALDSADYDGALELAYEALKTHPKQAWILDITYDLEIKAYNWEQARKILYRMEKVGSITTAKANSDRMAMYLAEADRAKENDDKALLSRSLNKAHKLDAGFVPCAMRLARMYIEGSKHRAAVSVIEAAWKINPHPDLVILWGAVYLPSKDINSGCRVRWFEKLLSFNPKSALGLQALAGALIDDGIWGLARNNLQLAQEIEESAELYKLWAHLEENAAHDDIAVAEMLDKANNAPSSRVWLCSETGRIYDQWTPISDRGLFNTISWDLPQGRMEQPLLLGII